MIEARYTLSLEDLRLFAAAEQRRFRPIKFRLITALMTAIVASISSALLIAPQWLCATGFPIVILSILVLAWAANSNLKDSTLNSLIPRHNEIALTADDHGLTISTSVSKVAWEWQAFDARRSYVTNELVVLCDKIGTASIIPRRGFSSSLEDERFLKLLGTHGINIPASSRR